MVKNLRIIQMMDSYYPHVDGVVNVVDNYAKTFGGFGDSCAVYVPKCGKCDDVYPYAVHRCPSISTGKEFYLPMPDMARGVTRRFKRAGINIIHAHTPFMMGHYGLKMSRKLHVPFVTTFHSKYYDDFLAYTGSKSFADFGIRYMLDFYKRADAVWTVNKGTAGTLRDYGFKGDITIMPNGVDRGSCYPADPADLIRLADDAYPLPCEGFPILFVGQLIWQKNHRLVLDTVKRLRDSGEKISLTVAGSGDDGEKITAYAKELGLEDCVAFLGRVNDRALLQGLYLRSSLFFFPSVYDNAPITLQEASLNRLPGLLMRSSNAAEDIIDGVNGYLCDDDPDTAAEIIKQIMSDREKRMTVGMEASRTIVNRWEDIIKDVRAEYIRLIDKKRG